MAKVTGPLLSLDARGSIAKTQTYSNWRGVKYVRQRVDPSNPNTIAQQAQRNLFRSMDSQWKLMSTLSRNPWNAAAAGRQFTGRNKLMAENITPLRGETDMLNWIGSPGALGGLAPTAVVAAATANPGELEITVSAPAEPLGWTLTACVAQAFLDRDPVVEGTDFVSEMENDTPTPNDDNVILFTGLNQGVLYIASAWTVWERPDGRIAYGNSLTDSGTPAST